MKRQVLLIHPRTRHDNNYRYFYIPYSILSLVGPLRRVGCEVTIIDGNVECSSDYDSLLSNFEDEFDCVGISVMIGHQIVEALKASNAIKKQWPTVPIVWGGSCPTMISEIVERSNQVDAIVRGAGELVFADFINSIRRKRQMKTSLSAGRFDIKKLIKREPCVPLDLNNFSPFSEAFDTIPLQAYIKPDEHIGSRTVNYHSSQGCPYKCGFCCETALWGGKWTGLVAGRVLKDIEILIESFGVNGIKFYDSEFFVNKVRALRIAELFISRSWQIRWAASANPLSLLQLKEDDWVMLERSGLSRLLIGAESGEENARALLGKRVLNDDLISLAKRCAAHGIAASFTFVTGLPGGSDDEIIRTLGFAASLRSASPIHEAKVHFYAPYPGTLLYPLAINHGFCPPKTIEEWSQYDYYNILTPWVPSRFQEMVNEFNRDNCPYVANSRYQ